MKCSANGCESEARYKAVQLCNRHYLRLRRHGSVEGGATSQGEPLDWLRGNVPAETDDCLVWPYGRFADGYGAIRWEGRKHRVHRLVCTMIHGDPPCESMDAAHTCGNGHLGCVNDRHLYWATRAQNLADRIAHGTANRGQRNGQAKLTELEAREILSLKGSGILQKDVAARFGVSRELVGRIWRRQIWEWL